MPFRSSFSFQDPLLSAEEKKKMEAENGPQREKKAEAKAGLNPLAREFHFTSSRLERLASLAKALNKPVVSDVKPVVSALGSSTGSTTTKADAEEHGNADIHDAQTHCGVGHVGSGGHELYFLGV